MWNVLRLRAVRAQRRARPHDRHLRLLDAAAAYTAASRRSGDAVLSAVATALASVHPRIDALAVFRPSADELTCVCVVGVRVEHVRGLRLRRDARVVPAAAAQRGHRVSPGSSALPLVPTDRFAVAVPMYDGSSLLAVAYAGSPAALDPALADAVVEVIERAALPYAVALEREDERADAARDCLTDLLTPRAFRRYLEDEAARVSSARQFCLWYVDIDGFKAVNDRFGHRAGDAALRAIAALLERHLVVGLDVGARNGGDEFCALLRATGKRRAIERALAFGDAVRAQDFVVPAALSASVGIAAYPHDATSPAELLEIADAAMYHSKRQGRDRVSFALTKGAYAALRSEAAGGLSRSLARCRVNSGESPERS